MESNVHSRSTNKREQNSFRNSWKLIENIILYAAIIAISLPIFIIVHRNLPNFDWIYNLDRILLYILILIILFIIVKFLRKLFVIICLGLLVFLIIESYREGYGFSELAEDYNAMILSMDESNKPQKVLLDKISFYSSDAKILKSIDYTNMMVRNYALNATNKYFKKSQEEVRYRTIIQSFAIFKEINENWNYVHDPIGHEYYAKASESIQTQSGDCDDYSILMAACIKIIGGTPRLIYTTGHIYPEIYIGDESDLETINYLIKDKLFPDESKGKRLFYHTDLDGKIWLNLDYMAKYPGGPFYKKEVLGIIDIK